MRKLLSASHAQIFFVWFIPFFIYLCIHAAFRGRIDAPVRFMGLLFTISAFIMLGWIYTFSKVFAFKLPEGVRFDMKLFDFCVLTEAIVKVSSDILFPDFADQHEVIYWLLSWFVFLCAIYYCYVAAYTLKAVERQRPMPFREFSGEFFGFLISPIGIWWLQPRINKIYKRETAPAI